MKTIISVILLLSSSLTYSSDSHHDHQSQYAGQEKREIKSLSPEDISELRRGGGWGLAKAAELNGVPGPAHLLELKDAIPLDAPQIHEITKIYKAMQEKAMDKGEELISLEKKLEDYFKNRTITESLLRETLNEIAQVRNDLRYIHLSTHLTTPQILSEQQISRYNELRGYSNPDPCAHIPAGHDPKMWRLHNGCN